MTTLRIEPIPPNGYATFEIHDSQPQAGAILSLSPRMWPSARTASANCSTRPTAASAIHLSTAPTAGRASASSRISPMTGRTPPWQAFQLCPDCQAEYENPLDRRFHAQPVACPVCGPQLWFEASGGTTGRARRCAAVWPGNGLRTAKSWRSKGLGGFHLACDASNPAAVAELRRRKKRSDKPFALMAFDLETIEQTLPGVGMKKRACSLRITAPLSCLNRRAESTIAAEAAPQADNPGVYAALYPAAPAPDSNRSLVFRKCW